MKTTWQTKPLGDIFLIERGGSPRPIDKYITNDPNGINWIKIGDTKNVTKYIYSTAEKIIPAGLNKTRLVNVDDFILSNSMSFGRPYIMKTTGAIHDGWLVLRKKLPDIDKDFFYHLLGSPIVFNQFDSLAAGSTVRNLNTKLVANVAVPFPSLSEQRRIAALLDEVFEKIEKAKENTENNLKNSRELFETFLNSILMNNNHQYIENKLNEVYDVRDGTHDSPKYQLDGYPLVTSKNLKREGLLLENIKYISETDYKKINQRSRVDKGDVLLAMIGTIGNPIVVDVEPKFAIKNVALFKVPKDQNPYFLKYYLQSRVVKDKLASEANGTTQKFVGLGYLRNFRINIPSLEEQNKLVNVLNTFLDQTTNLESAYKRKLIKLDELKNSVLNKAFAGEL